MTMVTFIAGMIGLLLGMLYWWNKESPKDSNERKEFTERFKCEVCGYFVTGKDIRVITCLGEDHELCDECYQDYCTEENSKYGGE